MPNSVIIDREVCKGCGLCVFACPKQVLALDLSAFNARGYNPSSVENPQNCIACGMCAIICPDSAITVEKEG